MQTTTTGWCLALLITRTLPLSPFNLLWQICFEISISKAGLVHIPAYGSSPRLLRKFDFLPKTFSRSSFTRASSSSGSTSLPICTSTPANATLKIQFYRRSSFYSSCIFLYEGDGLTLSWIIERQLVVFLAAERQLKGPEEDPTHHKVPWGWGIWQMSLFRGRLNVYCQLTFPKERRNTDLPGTQGKLAINGTEKVQSPLESSPLQPTRDCWNRICNVWTFVCLIILYLENCKRWISSCFGIL